MNITHLNRKDFSVHKDAWLKLLLEKAEKAPPVVKLTPIGKLSTSTYDHLTCVAPFESLYQDKGRRIVVGTTNGVYIHSRVERDYKPVKILNLSNVTQVEVVSKYNILIVLADKEVRTFNLKELNIVASYNAKADITHQRPHSFTASFFKTSKHKNIICIVTTFWSKSILNLFKFSHEGQLRFYKGFRIDKPFCYNVTIHKDEMIICHRQGFNIINIETETIRNLLNSQDPLTDVKGKQPLEGLPRAVYRVDDRYLVCCKNFAFYIDSRGSRSEPDFIIEFHGKLNTFSLLYPFLLVADSELVQVYDVTNGSLVQIIVGDQILPIKHLFQYASHLNMNGIINLVTYISLNDSIYELSVRA